MTTSFGLVGTGRAAGLHTLAIAATDGARLTHVAGRDLGRLRRWTGDTEIVPCGIEALGDAVDVAIVATPPATHLDVVERLVGRGAAILVETPLATTPADALAIEALAGPDQPIAVAEHLFGAAHVHAAIRAVGTLGPLRHLAVRVEVVTTGRSWSAPPVMVAGTRAVALALVAAGATRGTAPDPDAVEADGDHRLRLRFGRLVANCEYASSEEGGRWDLEAASDDGVVRLELAPARHLEVDGEPVDVPVRAGGELAELSELGYLAQIAGAARDPTALPDAAFGARLVALAART